MKITDLPIPEEAKQVIINTGITELYPPQEEAIKAGALEGKNLVLASPTASGKTLIAELCALKHVLEKGGKTLYLTPLRALANEKYHEFQKYQKITKPNGKNIRIGIATGDYDSNNPWLERYDIIITTNEKADSLLRHRTKWMDETTLVIADEIHLLNDSERGPTLEVVLARLMQINPDTQLLALSATVKNAQEAAEWLKANQITTEWRPVTLREGVLHQNEIQFKDGGAQKIDKHTSNPAINLAIHTIKTGGQALIFASTRKISVSLAAKASTDVDKLLSKPMKRSLEKLADEILTTGERTRISELLAHLIQKGTAYHHAGLGGTHRRLIENAFREGKIKLITATPTLAFGVNLPARMVIIQDYRRYEPGYGWYPIAVLDYKQMAGRAGRPKYDKTGEAILIAKTEDEREYLMESYILAQPERIWSKLAVERILRGHVLATIASEFAHTEQGIYDFFGKTFYAYQYDPKAIRSVIIRILKFLYDEEMIETDGDNIHATRFGRRISELYIDPLSGVIIREALSELPSTLTDLSYFQMIAHTPDIFPKLRPSQSEENELAVFADQHKDEWMNPLPEQWEDNIAYQEFLAEVNTALVLHSWIEETTEDNLIEKFRVQPGDLYRNIESAKWLIYATHELAQLFRVPKKVLSDLDTINERVEKGVKAELLQLVKLEGIGRVRARTLHNAGLKTLDDLKKAPLEKLTSLPLIGPKVAKKIKDQVGGFIKTEDLKRLKKGEEWEQKAITEY
jgi:helicase